MANSMNDQHSPPTNISSSQSTNQNDRQDIIEATLPTTFTSFPALPLELRRKIWGEFACCDPKIIDILPGNVYYLDTATGSYTFWDICQSPPRLPLDAKRFFRYNTDSNANQAPTILHVSSEARTVGFEFYIPEKISESYLGCFNIPVTQPDLPTSDRRSLWVNWTVDTLVVRAPRLTYWLAFSGVSYENEVLITVTGHLSDVVTEAKGRARIAFHESFCEYLEPPLVLDELIIYQRLTPIDCNDTDGFETMPFQNASPEDEFEETAKTRIGNQEDIWTWWKELCAKFQDVNLKLMLWCMASRRWHVSVSEAGSGVYGKCTENS